MHRWPYICGITYVINGQNNTAQFVDGTFTTINVEYVIIDLLDTRGRVEDNENRVVSHTPGLHP
jgi:hypothetical protein